MSKIFKNQKAGFLQVIILIIVAVCIMAYFHVTVSGVFHWIVNAFKSVF